MKKLIFIISALTIFLTAKGNSFAQDAGLTPDGFGMQAAWDNPSQNMGDGQSKPGYSQVTWEPGGVIPVRLRDGMITLINFPKWEKIKDAYIGDKDFFDGRPVTKNTFMISPIDGRSMADTNLVIFGDSGNKYVFYLKSEPLNAETTTNSEVDVIVPNRYKKGTAIGAGGTGTGGALKSLTGSRSSSSSTPVDFDWEGEDFGWIKNIPVDPTEFRFDLDIFVPNPDDYIIAPERVWRDKIFTYIDFGEKVINMNQRPTVSLLVENGEAPVGFRTEGPASRLIVVEAIGDLVLRNGGRIVCIKKREKPYLVTNPPMSIPAIPNNMVAGMNPMMPMQQPMGTMPMGVNPMMMPMQPQGMMPMMQGGYPQNMQMQRSNTVSNDVVNYKNKKKIKTNGSALPLHYVPIVKQKGTKVAIELKRGKSIKDLEKEWFEMTDHKAIGPILLEYEPFYSIESNGVDELGGKQYKGNEYYRLRIGPFVKIEQADEICKKLASYRVPCSVVRIQ